MSYLSVRNVSKSFGQGKTLYQALDMIQLEVEQGEFVCLIGHSGCGKSTLLNLIGGLERPSAGSLSLQGDQITSPGADRGMVFQHHSLLPWLSVYGNVYEAVSAVYKSEYTNEKHTRVERFLKLVGLWEHQAKKPSQLSGGMKQRVAIARAFSVQPKVLLLDEPFGALDALTKAKLQDELINLWQMDKSSETVIMVTHDIDEAIYLADRIVVMTNGPAATIGEIVPVDIARPRDRRAMVHEPEYAALKDRLLYLLTSEFATAVA
ncbi:MAG TPA: ABC transporter ATP-binding protein [Dehalococcoidia bacterium]|nr:ABC transporter ATP-binding protein [Dehalococcoidia bacterium]